MESNEKERTDINLEIFLLKFRTQLHGCLVVALDIDVTGWNRGKAAMFASRPSKLLAVDC